jgi:hypothetical protein
MSGLNIVRHQSLRLTASLKLCCGVLALVAATCAIPLAVSDEQPPLEYQVKAAFLYNFAKFVDWPPQKVGPPDSPLIIGVLGKDPFGGALEAVVAGKKFDQHTLIVRHVSGPAEARTCHLLFISRSEDNRLAAILKELRNSATLTIGESDKFIADGGIINFIIVDNKVRFEINPEAAGQTGLRISSKLLHVARVVTNRETADLR